jgi:hypothetical protein
MNESEHLDGQEENAPAETRDQPTIDELSNYERIIPRVLRNMLVRRDNRRNGRKELVLIPVTQLVECPKKIIACSVRLVHRN